ncbi:hypothetical protein V2W45_1474726 [Cenococcum geophilum]
MLYLLRKRVLRITLKLEKERGKALSFKLLFLLFAYIFATLSAINAVSIYNLKALSPYNSYLSVNILGGGGKLSGGGALNLKPNLNARGKTVSGLGVRPTYSRGRYYSRGITYPYIYLYTIYSCNNNSDNIYLYNLIKNGSYVALNKTFITISIVNRTRTIAINGTLPNGTTASSGLDLLALKQ